MNPEFWYFLIEAEYDRETGVFGNFFAYGQHCGQAMNDALEAARLQNFLNPRVMEAERLDIISDYMPPVDLIKLSDNVFMKPATNSFTLSDLPKEFVPPVGVIKSTTDGEYDYDLIQESFVAYGKNENGIYELELVVDKERLIETFLHVIHFLPEVNGFWIYIWNYWDNRLTELWASKNISEKIDVLNFLTKYKEDTLQNGYIDCVVHCAVGATNLTLDDHKKIQLHTEDETLFNAFGKSIMALGFKQTKEPYNLEVGYYHWHYRPFNSLSRKEYTQLLITEQFELIDSWSE